MLKKYTVTNPNTNEVLLVYKHTSALTFDQWPGCIQTEEEVEPELVPVYDGTWKITKFAFRNRFTSEEKVMIEMASLDKPGGSLQERTNAALLRVYNEEINAAAYIDLKRADVRTAIQGLESAGLLSQGRAGVILDTVPTAEEIYQ